MPADVTGRELDRSVRGQLRTLPDELAETVARHLVMAARLMDDDPAQALEHARAARRRAARVAVVREAVGIAAYESGEYAEALAELRAVRRMTGDDEVVPMLADCERGLGRPDRALALAREVDPQTLSDDARVELLLVLAGARADLGQDDAAVLTLQVPQLRSRSRSPWVARLRYGYAEALLGVGRVADAREWFLRAAEADVDAFTDAVDRVAAIDGDVVFLDEDEQDPDAGATPAPLDDSDPASER